MSSVSCRLRLRRIAIIFFSSKGVKQRILFVGCPSQQQLQLTVPQRSLGRAAVGYILREIQKEETTDPVNMSGGMCPFASSFQSLSSPRGGKTCPLGFGSNVTTSTTTAPTDHDPHAAASAAPPPPPPPPPLTCPLGFGNNGKPKENVSLLSFSGLPRMPLKVLAEHQSNEVRLVSIKGVVFDVSRDEAFRLHGTSGGSGRLARLAGHDASRFLANLRISGECSINAPVARGGTELERVIDDGDNSGDIVTNNDDTDGDDREFDVGLEGLTYEEHQRLESYFVRMAEERRAVAVLADDDHTRLFGVPFGGVGGAGSDLQLLQKRAAVDAAADRRKPASETLPFPSTPLSPPALRQVAERSTELHALVEQGNVEAVKSFLDRALPIAGGGDGGYVDVVVVNAPCARTGMTPLLKAVESACESLVQALLAAGADVRSQAMLYDGDDAIRLAERLGGREEIIKILRPCYM